MEEVTVRTLNLNKICRVCLTESEILHSIYSSIQLDDDIEEEIHYIYEILMCISAIKVDASDDLPNMICPLCIGGAQASFKFQKQCNRSQALLDAFLIQKKELEEKEAEEVQMFENNILNEINHDSDDTCDAIQTCIPLNLVLIESAQNCTLGKALEDIHPEEELPVIEEPSVKEEHVYGQLNEENQLTNFDSAVTSEPLDKNNVVATDCDLSALTKDEIKQEICKEKVNKTSRRKRKEASGRKRKSTKKYSAKTENGKKIYSCASCGRTYKHCGSLRIHMKVHNNEYPHKCSQCDKSFNHLSSLVYHKRGHTGEQPYTCKICGNKYRQSGTLTAHMRVHTGQKPFLCSICGRGFRQAPDLMYHMRTHTKERPYMCNVCGITMSMQCHLVQHMRSHTGERPFKCNDCGKAFPSSTRLRRHAIIHTGLKPYTCEVCEKSFNRSSSLKVHSKIHTDERPHLCPICSKGFIQANTLKSHIATHSSEIAIQLLS